jgi:hypothetical protein
MPLFFIPAFPLASLILSELAPLIQPHFWIVQDGAI